MTTNVFDTNTSVMASDSRWSAKIDNYLFYVDDVNYEKIVHDKSLAILFAGNLNMIDNWKNWFRAGRYGVPPAVSDELSMCIVDVASGVVRKDHGIKLLSACNGARFAGTGSPHALNCWTVNQNACKSVETACSFDLMSGGKVSYFIRTTAEHNLINTASAAQVIHAFLPRGNIIMLTGNPQNASYPIAEAILKDPDAKAAFEKVMASGTAAVCAPFIGMGTPWTEEETADLYAILNEYPPEPQQEK